MPIGEFSRRAGVSSKLRKPRIGQQDCRCGTRHVPQGQLATQLPGAGVVAVLGGRRAADGRDNLRRCESVLDLRVSLRHGRAGLGEALADRSISHGPASRGATGLVASRRRASAASSLSGWTRTSALVARARLPHQPGAAESMQAERNAARPVVERECRFARRSSSGGRGRPVLAETSPLGAGANGRACITSPSRCAKQPSAIATPRC